MARFSSVAAIVAVSLFAASVFLILQRGGLLAWSGAVLSLLMLAKVLFWPSPNDARTSLATLLVWGLAWIATWQYVKSVWESGEVVEVRIEELSEVRTARLWVIDLNGQATAYYDSPPDVANDLLAGTPITMTRNGSTVSGCASAVRVSSAPEAVQTEFLALMDNKYQERNMATEIFYRLLGGDRQRVPIFLHVAKC